MEVYVYSKNVRQGKEFPLFFHCKYVAGALCTRRCLHHHHAPLAIGNQGGFTTDNHRLEKAVVVVVVVVAAVAAVAADPVPAVAVAVAEIAGFVAPSAQE